MKNAKYELIENLNSSLKQNNFSQLFPFIVVIDENGNKQWDKDYISKRISTIEKDRRIKIKDQDQNLYNELSDWRKIRKFVEINNVDVLDF